MLRGAQATGTRRRLVVLLFVLLQAAHPAAEDWNFTPADFDTLTSGGGNLDLHGDSAWVPPAVRDNLLKTLRKILDPKLNPPSTGRASAAENLLLAKVWIDADRHQNALDLLDRLSVTEPLLENRKQILRGLALEGLVRPGEAWSAYEAALAAVPDDPAALMREAAYSFRSGDTAKALRFATQSIGRQPGNAEGYYLIYVLNPDVQAREQALVNLIAADGPDGPWATRALSDRPR